MNFSAYTPIMFLFPFTAPLVRVLARELPDGSLRKMMASRKVVVDSVADLIRQHRKVMAEEVMPQQTHRSEPHAAVSVEDGWSPHSMSGLSDQASRGED